MQHIPEGAVLKQTTALHTANDALRRGWKPIPARGKQPLRKSWHTLVVNSENVDSLFGSSDLNVGIQLGAASGGLTDVDLDSPEAIAVAPFLLPKTACIFGRKSKRASHWLYQTDLHATNSVATTLFKDPIARGEGARALLCELRIGGGDKGAQTIIPHSIHPSGELCEFESGCDGDPAPVAGQDLIKRVNRVAAAALAARHWPAHGARHGARLALSGLLVRCMLQEEAQLFADSVAAAVGDEDTVDFRAAIEGTSARFASGEPITGISAAHEVFGPKVTKKLVEWLDVERGDQDQKLDPSDTRRRFRSPPKDSELTPILRLLDDVLLTNEAEPPMRDLDGRPIEVKYREPSGMHLLTSDSANNEDEDSSRLPPPPTYMFIPHDATSMAMLIEQHALFFKVTGDGEMRYVRLDPSFINSYIAFRSSRLPKADKLMTLPIVLPDGSLLSAEGLDQKRKIVFRIDDGVRNLLPGSDVSDTDVVKAMGFLTEQWLCDVQTDYSGKAVFIAFALTVLERAVLEDRPVFWVTAGKRGSGKTTVLTMVGVALTGERVAAAAWSPNEEERRKAVFSMLLQSAPLVVFDNIPRCPSSDDLRLMAA